MSSTTTPSPLTRRTTSLHALLHTRRRLIVRVAIIFVVVLAALEVGVRIVTPDTMQVTVYNSPSAPGGRPVLYDHTITDPAKIASTYQALTQTPADWADIGGYFKNPYDRMYSPVRTCQQGDVMSNTPSSYVFRWVLRFLWHGLPVTVITHYPAYDNPYPLWTCQGNMAEWQVSAGGVVNPRPYVDNSTLQFFQDPN